VLPAPVTSIAAHPINKSLVVSSEDGRIYFYSVKSLHCFGQMKLRDDNFPTTLEFSKDGTALIGGTNNGTVFVITSTNWD